MMGLSTKVLLIAFSGFGGIAGWASLSSLNLDPKHLWRITNNSKFYLSHCFDKEIKSDLWMHLTPKQQVSNIQKDTQLELWAEGYQGNNKFLEISLQESLSDSPDSEYEIRAEKLEGKKIIRLGENSAGDSSHAFGATIQCSDQIFDLTSNDFETSEYINLRLDKVTFTLEEKSDNSYKGSKVYSIKIENTGDSSKNKKLSWVNGFQPIVIV